MKHHPLVAYYKEKQKALNTQLAQLRKQPTEEAIHQFRVAVKKMRAVLGMVQLVSEGVYNPKGHLAIIRPLFKTMGGTREAQVNLGLLATLENPNLQGFRQYLENKVIEGLAFLPPALESFDEAKLHRLDAHLIQGMKGLSQQQVEAKATEFVQQKLKKAKNLLPKVQDDHYLHKVRILLKQVHEILVLLNTLAPDKEYESLRAPISELNTRIGDWHDWSVLLETLREYQAMLEAGEVTELDEIREQISAKNEGMKREIGGMLVEALES